VVKLLNNYLQIRTISSLFFDFLFLFILFLLSIKLIYSNESIVNNEIIVLSLLLTIGIVLINNSLGFYQNKIVDKNPKDIKTRGVVALILSLILAYLALIYSSINVGDEFKFIFSIVASVVFILTNRLFVFHRLHKGFLRQRILVYGSGKRAISAGQKLIKSDAGIDFIGYYTGLNEAANSNTNSYFLSSKKTLTEHVVEQKVDEIVVALSERRGGSMPLRELLDCKLSGVIVVDVASHFEKKMGKINSEYISVGSLIFGEGFKQGFIRSSFKRLFDILFSLILISLLFPILIITGFLIVFESGRPIIYCQERVGLNGKLFNIYKLRSMRNNAEEKDKPVWAMLQDDRITRVGKIIRKFRIDELPQLFSVLTGHMSLVGPRPERNFFVKKLIKDLPFYEVRQSVKPGLTGWAQVRYHYGASVEDAAEKLQYDLYYVKNNSIFLDFIILFETIGVVITGKGAH
jgi:sugar transferase (PEP-CTERM system associated)